MSRSRSRPLGVQTRSSGSGGPWQYALPPELLAQVFEFLTKEDLLKARLICHQWKDVTELPQFWTKGRFGIRGQNDTEVKQVSGYMKTFGSHLQRLHIDLEIRKVERRTKAQSHRVFTELRELLKTTKQLRSFAFHNWNQLTSFKFQVKNIPFDKATILNDVCSLLRRQEGLDEVDFKNSSFSKKDWCRILRALRNTAANLKSLSLHHFFQSQCRFDLCPAFMEIAGQFEKLVSVGLTYYYLSDAVLDKLTSASPSLKRIVLYAEMYNLVTFSRPDWQKVARERPELSVLVIISMDLWSMEYGLLFHELLMPDMPLVGLLLNIVLEAYNDHSVEIKLTRVTTLLTHYRPKIFILGYQGRVRNPWSRPEQLVALVNACPSLRHLSLEMTLTSDTLQQVAAAAAARPGLKNDREQEDGHCVRPPLQMHILGCDAVQERLSHVNPFLTVHLYDGCQQLLLNQFRQGLL